MIGIVWAFMIISSVVCAICTQRIDELCNSIIEGSKQSISIVIMISGAIIFWSGIMKIAQDGKFTNFVIKIFFPILKLLFSEYSHQKEILNPICINIISNLLGLSNAATPSGIKAMKKMNKNNSMNSNIMKFLLINISCIQLSPNFLIISRKTFGSHNPYEILPKIWICSLVSLIVGISLINIFSNKVKTIRINKKCLKV